MRNSIFKKIYNEALRSQAYLESLLSPSYSKLYIISDQAGWVLDEEARELNLITQKLGHSSKILHKLNLNIPQVVHYTSQFSLLDTNIYKDKNRISIDYFHGKPEQGENFKRCFDALKLQHERISRIRVSNSDMESLILSSGIAREKVFKIHIALNSNTFEPQTDTKKQEAREKYNLPHDAVVIGSFQKDGVGWSEGNEPKLIKGPDVFLKTIARLKNDIPNLWVLLSGPSRGYVINGLKNLGVPYRHYNLPDYEKVSSLYDCLDIYLITSREEGGPKACLESMSKGIPLVTTAVGQCKDIVKNGQNAMMTSVEDDTGLYKLSLQVIGDTSLRSSIIRGGLITASENTYTSQLPLWKEYFGEILK